jgi:hypothetical protein
MGTINKITGSLATAINKVSISAISGVAKVLGQVVSLFSNTKSLSHGVVNTTDAVEATSTSSDFQLIQTDAWSISFWIKAGWTESLNTSFHLIASDGGSVHNNMWRVWYNENNNRLYMGFRSASNQKSNNFWCFHNDCEGTTGTSNSASGLGTANTSSTCCQWNATNRGYVNSQGFNLITLTKGTGVNMARTNFKGYWNSSPMGNAYYVNGNNTGTIGMSSGTARNFAIGNNSWTLAGGQGGNGVATLFDEVSLWSKELTQSDVNEIWNGTVAVGATDGEPRNLQTTTMTSDLIGWWRFETDGTVSTVGSATLTLDGDSTSVTTPA